MACSFPFFYQTHLFQSLLVHADPFGIEDMYFNISSDAGNPNWMTLRGCSKGEGYHPGLHRIFRGTNYSPRLAKAIVALHNLKWVLHAGAAVISRAVAAIIK